VVEGPIAIYFSDLTHDADEGTFSKAWERVFQCSEIEHLVIRGKYGLELVLAYIAHFSRVLGIEADNGLYLMAERVDSLIALLES
jgi:hypothetical protein